jgi:hypothetical protein
LTCIEASAFSESVLESIALPSSVQKLGHDCFASCQRLTTVMFPADSKLVRIESKAFAYCRKLGPIRLPTSVERIPEYCFSGCDSMSNLAFSLPSHLRELLDLPTGLTEVIEIPDSVEVISMSDRQRPPPGLDFGSESKLQTIKWKTKRSFLRFACQTLKRLRADIEFKGIDGILPVSSHPFFAQWPLGPAAPSGGTGRAAAGQSFGFASQFL